MEKEDFEKIKEKFKDHVLEKVLDQGAIRIYNFKNKDGSFLYYQRWIFDRGTLIVQGDCYDAIYKWDNSRLSLEFLSQCGLGYFSEKCLADKDGSMQRTYEAGHAEEYMKIIAIERIYDSRSYLDHDPTAQKIGEITNDYEVESKWDELSLDEKFHILSAFIMEKLDIDDYDLDGLFYHEYQPDAHGFMCKKEHEFMFGTDAWEYDLTDYTLTPKHHLAALHVAYEKFPHLDIQEKQEA